jgi:hypothetical protein
MRDRSLYEMSKQPGRRRTKAMTWDMNVLVIEVDYRTDGNELGTKMVDCRNKYWGRADLPDVGDLVSLIEIFGYQQACCGHSMDAERNELAKPYIGKMLEITLIEEPRLPGRCVVCEACDNHHHIIDNVFRYAIRFPGTDQGLMVGLHEIAPTFQAWDMEGMNLDPTS